MEKPPYAEIKKGTLLIAAPENSAGLFFRGVILLCEHNPNGSFGLVINKVLDLELPEEIVTVEQVTNQRVGLRAGGPLQTNQMMLLHTSGTIPEQTLEICEGVYLGGDLEFLQKCLSDDKGSPITLCFGYTGWGAGQLEREFLDGKWFLYPASKELLFDVAPENLWQHLLRTMGGKYATLSMIPEDLTLN